MRNLLYSFTKHSPLFILGFILFLGNLSFVAKTIQTLHTSEIYTLSVGESDHAIDARCYGSVMPTIGDDLIIDHAHTVNYSEIIYHVENNDLNGGVTLPVGENLSENRSFTNTCGTNLAVGENLSGYWLINKDQKRL